MTGPATTTSRSTDATADAAATVDATGSGAPAGSPPSEPIRILVNGKRYDVHGRRVSFEQLAALAAPHVAREGFTSLTVAFRNGPAEAPDGLLTVGYSTPIGHEEAFVVTVTDRS